MIAEIRSVLAITANWMAIPLFLAFWIADILYVPEHKWEFLAIRLAIIPICVGAMHLSRKLTSLLHLRLLALTYASVLASGINLMILMIGDPSSSYYAGLGMVAIGALSFIPFKKGQFVGAAFTIYGPYYLMAAIVPMSGEQIVQLIINSFFIVGSLCICFLVRFFHEGLRIKELEARVQLSEEIQNRDELIRIKSEEAVKLNSLSNQFSPQVIESIRAGKIDLEGANQRAEICTLFIDIVNSTERVTRIDKEKFLRVLSQFLDDTIKILLKYDITIDKFLGDGILAFSNAPLKRSDFCERVVRAALEIKEKVKSDQEFYEINWQRSFQIRIGIAKGFSNVGFYGGKKHFKSYTAIGPVVNLASRLCSVAEPDQIIIEHDVYEQVKDSFDVKFSGKKTLKGFDSDIIYTYQVESLAKEQAVIPGVSECADCGSVLSLETDAKGHYVFVCRSCCNAVSADSLSVQKPATKVA